MKPNYLVIGASKCATSSLCHQLGQHPAVFISQPKEPNFFCNDDVYARGWSWYETLFANATGKTAIGEGSGRYSARQLYPRTAERIARHLPDAKLIYITRHPLDRLESFWLQKRSQGDPVSVSFSKALRENPGWIDSSNYLHQIDAYRVYFADSQILVLFYDDFKAHPWAVLRQCFEFLEVDQDVRILDVNKPINRSEGKKTDTAALTILRGMPGYGACKALVPASTRRVLKQTFLRWRVRKRPLWHVDTREWVIDQLAEETRVFLQRYGKSAAFWDLNGDTVGRC